MTHGSLFSGIGGFDLAAQWMGWTNVFHCEIAEIPRKILNYHFPESISYADIKATDFNVHRGSIDVLSGGFPCQPFSLAGKRKGKDDDRYLWKEMLRAVRQIQPKWIVGENVFGIVNWSDGLVFEEVCSDLEAEGYEVQSYLLPAASTGAPHQRMRCWFVAHSRKFRLELCTSSRTMGEGQKETCGERRESPLQSTPTGTAWDAADTDRNGLVGSDSEHEKQSGERGFDAQRDIKQGIGDGDVADTMLKGLQGSAVIGGIRGIGSNGKKFINGCVSSAWEKFPTVRPICSGDDGISTRLDGITFSKWRQESIKGYGNAVIPQLVYRIFDTIQQYENL